MTTKSVFQQNFPPKSQYSIDDVPDCTGKVVIITGGNTGIGKETAKVLLERNAKVYLACRSKQKAEDAIRELKDTTGREALFLQLDLANLTAVKRAAQEYMSMETELHILFNNGGVMTPPLDQLTVDGYDLQIGTNALGHFFFTQQLLPVLLHTAASSGAPARVVNTSSVGHHMCKRLRFEVFKDGPERKRLSTMQLYAQSKFANVVFAKELGRRYGDQGIVSTSLHPGNLRTDLQRNNNCVELALIGWMLHDAPKGALTQLYAGTSPEGVEFDGKYLVPWARLGEPAPGTQDLETGRALWEWFEAQVKDV